MVKDVGWSAGIIGGLLRSREGELPLLSKQRRGNQHRHWAF
jgi:hypothetical protein